MLSGGADRWVNCVKKKILSKISRIVMSTGWFFCWGWNPLSILTFPRQCQFYRTRFLWLGCRTTPAPHPAQHLRSTTCPCNTKRTWGEGGGFGIWLSFATVSNILGGRSEICCSARNRPKKFILWTWRACVDSVVLYTSRYSKNKTGQEPGM